MAELVTNQKAPTGAKSATVEEHATEDVKLPRYTKENKSQIVKVGIGYKERAKAGSTYLYLVYAMQMHGEFEVETDFGIMTGVKGDYVAYKPQTDQLMLLSREEIQQGYDLANGIPRDGKKYATSISPETLPEDVVKK